MTEPLLERRAMVQARIEADTKRLRGYAIVFNVRSHDLGGFVEVIEPEAVDRTLLEAIDVFALVDHKRSRVIGRTRAGTLELAKDARGLRVAIDVDPAISYAGDILRSVQRGDVTGMSFAFQVPEGGDQWDWEGRMAVRTVRDMRISEVSIVSAPAYPQTDVAVAQRSLNAFQSAHPAPSLAHRWRQLKHWRVA